MAAADPSPQQDLGADGADGAQPLRDQNPQGLTAAAGSRAKPPLFSFSQVEVPWLLGPPDGRYLARRGGDGPDAPATHVLLFSTLSAPRHRRIVRRQRPAAPEPEPAAVATARATVIGVAEPFASEAAARDWLRNAGEERLAVDLAELNRALHAYRLVTADPYVHTLRRSQALVARIGYGEGEEVADGRWADARELLPRERRQRRSRALEPQARLAAVLAGRERPLACEELVLRARLDLSENRDRVGALQLLAALDGALAELSDGQGAAELASRLGELRERRGAIADAAQRALHDALTSTDREQLTLTLSRLEAVLRARAVSAASRSG